MEKDIGSVSPWKWFSMRVGVLGGDRFLFYERCRHVGVRCGK